MKETETRQNEGRLSEFQNSISRKHTDKTIHLKTCTTLQEEAMIHSWQSHGPEEWSRRAKGRCPGLETEQSPGPGGQKLKTHGIISNS